MDVGAWLRNLGLEQYEAAFHDNSVDRDILPRLTGEDLKELGVASVGHRRKLFDAISELRSATTSAAATEAPAPSSPSGTSHPARGSEVAAERRPITVMFCDLVGSTSLAAKLDPEDWRNLVNAYLDEATKAVTGLGGHVLKRLGDGLMALFGYPQAQRTTPSAPFARRCRSSARWARSTPGTPGKDRPRCLRASASKVGALSSRRQAKYSATHRTSPLGCRPPPSLVLCSSR
jgi:class 3 adenylate cyclase